MQNYEEILQNKIEEGILIKNYDIYHVNFKTNNIEKYIGNVNLINFKFVGDLFNIGYTIKRYTALEYEEAKDGLWKLININISIPEGIHYFYYFKNNITQEIIVVTDNKLLNNGLLYINYNLVIIENYKSFDWKPYIKNEIIPCNYQKIKILDYLDVCYLAQKDDNTKIAIFYVQPIPNYYIGKNILIELLPKYICLNILYKNNNKEQKKYYSELIIGNNISISNIKNNKYISIRFYTTLDDYTFVGVRNTFITDENIGKKYNFNINQLLVTRYVTLNENSDYTLVSILNFIEIKIYCFSDQFGYIYYILIENNPDISSFLGKKFEFETKNLLLGTDISNNNKGTWEFLSVIDEIYNFKNLETNEISPFLINNQTTPALSNIGKIFNMNTSKVFFIEFM